MSTTTLVDSYVITSNLTAYYERPPKTQQWWTIEPEAGVTYRCGVWTFGSVDEDVIRAPKIDDKDLPVDYFWFSGGPEKICWQNCRMGFR